MAEHVSSGTSPADHLLRTGEIEAVLSDLREKVKNIEAPEPPDLTALKELVHRMYRIGLFGATLTSVGWNTDPTKEMIFDDSSAHRSFFTSVFGVDGYGRSWAQYMIKESSSSVMRLTFGNDTNIARWLDLNGQSLATATVGSPETLEALKGKSVANAVGTAETLDALRNRSVLELLFGNSDRVLVWTNSMRSLAEGVYGDGRPSIVDPPLADQIVDLEARIRAVENRLSRAGV